jgi:hypothetical protein
VWSCFVPRMPSQCCLCLMWLPTPLHRPAENWRRVTLLLILRFSRVAVSIPTSSGYSGTHGNS